ncbi:hypothetical protein CDL15_Pgr017398 [Punica granatum]|uniref:Uncharacterized protein n=1 Tax=Punica granatum TaxID=22663 RepID=A0A218Y331_PUNGR|nr:hypothetical protein CDL15_Pgr017398 [Punica granatum]
MLLSWEPESERQEENEREGSGALRGKENQGDGWCVWLLSWSREFSCEKKNPEEEREVAMFLSGVEELRERSRSEGEKESEGS